MGGSIAAGAVRAGLVNAADMTVADPGSALADRLKSEGIEIRHTTDNRAAVAGADMILVAVKPWLMEQVLGEISDVIDRKSQSVVSIAAGVSFEQLGSHLRTDRFGAVGLYRVIPNTAISLGKSVTFIASHGSSAQQDSNVMELFKALGDVFVIGEKDITAVTALSSSGIAYALRYLDAASAGGEQMGIPRDEALKIVIATMKGAIALLEANDTDPQTEIDKVTTPGGITLKGLEAMEKSGFSQSVADGLFATKC